MGKELKKALLLFAKQPIPGTVKTRLVPPLTPEEATDLYGCMLTDTISRIGSLTDVEKYLFYDGNEEAQKYFTEKTPGMTCLPQRGCGLGERMIEALREVFARGKGSAVIIGSDSPDLPLKFIEEAFARLDKGECEVVFGPTDDGGYYLLGMTRLHRELFREIPWSSSQVLLESVARAKGAEIGTSILTIWHDVDTPEDLKRPELLDEANNSPLTRSFLLELLRRTAVC